MKISFKNDYSEGCHPNILKALADNNLDQQAGYGLDSYCIAAAELIKTKCKAPKASVHFVSGGTQANLLIISAMLRPHESVIAAETGHIATNETGAIEATGHKVSTIKTEDGKLSIANLEVVLARHDKQPHQLKPKMVYISNATELGTTYSAADLKALYTFCSKNEMLLFMDGARLGHALMAKNADLTLAAIAQYTDVFYIGGTKNGALLGEAIVICNEHLQEDFEYHRKQKGAMLSKGRILGMQFLELMQNDLYFELAAHANEQAMQIKKAFEQIGVDFLTKNFTNQLFPILTNEQIEKLSASFEFYVWEQINKEKAAVRIITSWTTSLTSTKALADSILALKQP